ncbi:MAG: hypothetical protein FVQ82_05745 [Planctomycetes bacterium]|nr:hypothetical protein [Planctomycetota bacterium]
MIAKKFIFAVLAFLVCFAGCGKKADNAKKQIFIMCDSSFILPATRLCKEFKEKTGIDSVITVSGSAAFLPMVKARKEGDILITHDPFIEHVSDTGALAANAEVGFVAAVIAVRKGNPRGIKSIEDLTAEGITVALTNPQYSTFGKRAYQLLESKSIKETVLKNVGTRFTKDDTDLANFLKLGAVDAVIMSGGAAKAFEDSLEIIRIPNENHGSSRIHVIGLNYSENSMAIMQFIEFARDHGSDIFAKHGYAK